MNHVFCSLVFAATVFLTSNAKYEGTPPHVLFKLNNVYVARYLNLHRSCLRR